MGTTLFLINKASYASTVASYVPRAVHYPFCISSENLYFLPMHSRMIPTVFVSFFKNIIGEKILFKANKTPQ